MSKLDSLLMVLMVACSAFSVLLLYSITYTKIMPNVGESYYRTQIIATLLGIFACGVLVLIDYKWIAKLWFLYGPACIILVLLTFTSLGVTPDSSEGVVWFRWLKLGPLPAIQPSELLKLGFIMTMSLHISKVKERINNFAELGLIGLHTALPVVLVVLQNDYGTAMLFIVLTAAMLFAAGISWKFIAGGLATVPGLLLVAWYFVISDVHKKRITVTYFEPGSDPQGYEWQQLQGLTALRGGKLLGLGFFDGTDYTKVSQLHNDFIFAHIGQTTGFVGSVLTVVVLSAICIRIIANAQKSPDLLGKLICTGTFAMIFSHFILNIGMVLKFVPVIGIPLPFISGGGTAMVSMYVAAGLTMSVYAKRNSKESFD
jgi:rod shape determining protein RodA